jgi:hypothetical protein
LVGEPQRLKTDIYGNREFLTYLRNGGKVFDRGVCRIAVLQPAAVYTSLGEEQTCRGQFYSQCYSAGIDA